MKTEKLNVVYACNNNYAPYACVSICSLLMNNKKFSEIDIYVVLEDVAEENIQKLQRQTEKYGANLIAVDAGMIIREMKKLKLPKYRGSHAANCRIFFERFIREDVEKFLYLDCDTIVTGDLQPLLSEPMGDNCACAVRDALTCDYKKLVGFRDGEPYFNSGVILIDVGNWRKYDCTSRIIEHLRTVRSDYCNPDQDVLNILLKGRVRFVGPQYNYQPIHRLLKDKSYLRIYSDPNYYSEEELVYAKNNPVIYHSYRFLGEFPWHKDTWHPDRELFDYYLSKSCQGDYVKQAAPKSLVIAIEKILYILLPRPLFFKLHKLIQDSGFRKRNQRLQRNLRDKK